MWTNECACFARLAFWFHNGSEWSAKIQSRDDCRVVVGVAHFDSRISHIETFIVLCPKHTRDALIVVSLHGPGELYLIGRNALPRDEPYIAAGIEVFANDIKKNSHHNHQKTGNSRQYVFLRSRNSVPGMQLGRNVLAIYSQEAPPSAQDRSMVERLSPCLLICA